jgi:putative Holliday junction resolvase
MHSAAESPQSGLTPPALTIVLAFDYGTRRIGVASGNSMSRVAQPLCTLERKPDTPWQQIDKLLCDYAPGQLIVGIPHNEDGTPTGMTAVVQAFANQLTTRSHLPVALVDEGHSSKEAERELASMRRSGIKTRRVSHADVDMVAARVILQRWFDQHKKD